MRRRDFIRFFGGTVAVPALGSLVARAQQRAAVAGLLNMAPIDSSAAQVDAFRQGLAEIGFVEGQNLSIEYRSALNQTARLPALAADLVRLRVDAIAATGTSAPGLAAK